MMEIEVKGKNVEEAIAKGLQKLNCTKDDVEIKIIDEGSSGLFGLMGAKPATVFLALKKQNSSKGEPQKICKKTEEILTEIIGKMKINVENVKIDLNDDTLNAEVVVSDSSFVIGKNGQTLDSIEYLTQIIINNTFTTKIKVNLDCENYRKKQVEKLQILADKALEYVKRTNKIYRFEPMTAKERKIIHLYIKNILGYESFSEGKGSLRKVGIKPVKKTQKK